MMMKSALSKGSLHVALAPPHLHVIPTKAWNLHPWPPVHNPRHIKICTKASHTLCLHTALAVDGRPFTPGHLIHPIPLKAPPPPIVVLLMPMFPKALEAFRNVVPKHGQPKWPNILQHGIYIMLKAQ